MTKRSSHLKCSRTVKDDEFYSRIEDIREELQHYEIELRGSKIYCNCDDYTKSQFYSYFKDRFIELDLVSVDCTEHSISRTPIHANLQISNGKIVETIRPLAGDGDFASDECKRLMAECDIVCTNPPFSLLRKYFAQVKDSGKLFLISCTINLCSTSEVGKFLIDGSVRYGLNRMKRFDTPEGDAIGNNCSWITNMVSTARKALIPLSNKPHRSYRKFHNYDAISVNSMKDIPDNYYGVIGAPLTFVLKDNQVQFKILGFTDGRVYDNVAPLFRYGDGLFHKVGNPAVKFTSLNSTPTILEEKMPDGNYYTAVGVAGYLKSVYKRVLIKRIEPNG